MPNADPLRLFWFLPTAGDGPRPGAQEGWRPAEFDYLQQIAQASDRLGFKGVLLPTGPALGIAQKPRDPDTVGRDFVDSRLVRSS